MNQQKHKSCPRISSQSQHQFHNQRPNLFQTNMKPSEKEANEDRYFSSDFKHEFESNYKKHFVCLSKIHFYTLFTQFD
ncbi:hypothetical protein PM8797T_01899 [Gimesia maris DSM 8797]|nr:hypothetical protein PM8797T_01899 [Gimesia maris DSM 8797]